MNEPDATACAKFLLLKQEYESALQEEALYEYGGAASVQQAIRYESAAIAVSSLARERLVTHYKGCPRCKEKRVHVSEPANR